MKRDRSYLGANEEQSKIADSIFKLLEGQSTASAEATLNQVRNLILVNSVVKELPDEQSRQSEA